MYESSLVKLHGLTEDQASGIYYYYYYKKMYSKQLYNVLDGFNEGYLVFCCAFLVWYVHRSVGTNEEERHSCDKN